MDARTYARNLTIGLGLGFAALITVAAIDYAKADDATVKVCAAGTLADFERWLDGKQFPYKVSNDPATVAAGIQTVETLYSIAPAEILDEIKTADTSIAWVGDEGHGPMPLVTFAKDGCAVGQPGHDVPLAFVITESPAAKQAPGKGA